jgi:hypothetical protein
VVVQCTAQQGPGHVQLRVLAYERQPTPLGGYFRYLHPPEATTGGQSVFLSDFTEEIGDGESTEAVWIDSGGGLIAAIVEGQPAPGIDGGGAGGVPFAAFGSMVRGGGPDQICFDALLQFQPHDPDRDETIWVYEPDLRLLAQEGEPAPSLDGVRYDGQFEPRAVSPWGPVVFRSTLRGDGVDSTNDVALFANHGVESVLLLREGQEFSPDYAGVYMADLSSGSFDQTGRVAMQITLAGPNVLPENDNAILMGVPGDLSIPIRRGEQAAGVDFGLNYGRINETSLSAHGILCFNAELNLQGSTNRAGDCVWQGPPDDLTLLARDGMTLPGTGLTIKRCRGPVQNERGDVVFRAQIDPSQREPTAIVARWAGDPELHTIAYTGQHAPGTEPDTVFSDAVEPAGPYLTETGSVAFVWWLAGPDINDSNAAGLWAIDPWGDLELVLRGGALIELADGEVRTVSRIHPRRGSQSGTHLNRVVAAQGDIAILVEFTDGTFAQIAGDVAPCLGDFNGNGGVNSLDLLAFLNAWVAGDARADVDEDGEITTLDVIWFLRALNLEC